MANFCMNCGAKLTEGARFCPECGTRLDTAKVPQEVAPQQEVPQQVTPQAVTYQTSEPEKPKFEAKNRNGMKYKPGYKAKIAAIIIAVIIGIVGIIAGCVCLFVVVVPKVVVQHSHYENYDDRTVEDAFDNFFKSPDWSVDFEDSNFYVIFEGKCYFDGEYEKVKVYFKLHNSFDTDDDDPDYDVHKIKIGDKVIKDDDEIDSIMKTIMETK